MVEIRHITLSGHADAIELTPAAHERLLAYLAEARTALVTDPDGDETIRDIETSLGDQLRSVADSTRRPIDDVEMIRLLTEAGAVESQHPTTPAPLGPPRGAFWCRIDQGKWLGGLCLGIATRGEFRVDWVRTVALLLALATGGLLAIVYLVALLLVPRVESVEDYRRLREAPRSR